MLEFSEDSSENSNIVILDPEDADTSICGHSFDEDKIYLLKGGLLCTDSNGPSL